MPNDKPPTTKIPDWHREVLKAIKDKKIKRIKLVPPKRGTT